MNDRQKEYLGSVESNCRAITHLAYEAIERFTGEQPYEVKDAQAFIDENYRYLYLATLSMMALAESAMDILESKEF